MARQRTDLARALEREGWRLFPTRGGHWRAIHPRARAPLFFASTSGDKAQPKLVLSQARRLLR